MFLLTIAPLHEPTLVPLSASELRENVQSV